MPFPYPPEVDGTVAPRGKDAAAIWWWSIVGCLYQAHAAAASRRERVGAAVMAGAIATAAWLAIAAQAARFRRGRRHRVRYYLNSERTACIAVVTGRAGWTVAEHWSAHPGRGLAAPLRRAVCMALVEAADRTGTPIRLDAASAAIAPLYAAALPGLVDVGPAKLFGRRMMRTPAGA